MVKPVLPEEIASFIPCDVLRVIYSYVPHTPKPSPSSSPNSSPSLQRELKRIQMKHLSGKSAMYMYDFEDFVLDGYSRKRNTN